MFFLILKIVFQNFLNFFWIPSSRGYQGNWKNRESNTDSSDVVGKSAIDFCELHTRCSVREELKKAKMKLFPWWAAMVDLPHAACTHFFIPLFLIKRLK